MTDAAIADTPRRRDGRHSRGERTRADIVAACRALMRAGNFRPSAAGVAEAAGYSVRSIFQHFAELEVLHHQALDQTTRLAIFAMATSTDDIVAAVTHAAVFGRPMPAE